MGKLFEKALVKERGQILEILRATIFEQLDPEVIHKQIIPIATYSPWESDSEFINLYSQIKNNTLVDIYRCFELWSLVKDLGDIKGDILEVGVWRGGTGALLCRGSENDKNTKVYLADTFMGVVKASEADSLYRGGEHSDTSEQIVRDLLTVVNANNYEILKGIFPDDYPNVVASKLKLCHIDVDTFLSAKDIFEYIWPKIEIGGVVVFDDYGFWSCEGVTKYFNHLKIPNGRKIHNLNGHGIIIKTNA